jgi:putative (di)nucleoside polyphosphate hydrolase
MVNPVLSMDKIRYRPNVAAIIRRDDGKIVIAERSDAVGCWQFPQGGIKNGEQLEEALERELIEEISLQPSDYEVIEQKGPYRYLFNKGRVKDGYHGQEQQYFLIQIAPSAIIDVQTDEPEFRNFRWITPSKFDLEWIPKFKREVYKQVFRDFFQVEV